jgi:hypothetical protein
VTGKYFGMNESCFVARATVGSFAIGAYRDQPVQSSHQLAANERVPASSEPFDWVEEYNELVRLERTPTCSST